MDGSLRGTGREFQTPNRGLIPTKLAQLVLRKTAFAHEEYKNYVHLTDGLIQAESNDLCARSTSNSRQASRTHPRRNPKVMGSQDPKKENL